MSDRDTKAATAGHRIAAPSRAATASEAPELMNGWDLTCAATRSVPAVSKSADPQGHRRVGYGAIASCEAAPTWRMRQTVPTRPFASPTRSATGSPAPSGRATWSAERGCSQPWAPTRGKRSSTWPAAAPPSARSPALRTCPGQRCTGYCRTRSEDQRALDPAPHGISGWSRLQRWPALVPIKSPRQGFHPLASTAPPVPCLPRLSALKTVARVKSHGLGGCTVTDEVSSSCPPGPITVSRIGYGVLSPQGTPQSKASTSP